MPQERQEQLAGLLLHEMQEDERWLQSTATHADKLNALAAEILTADRRGECEPLDPDSL